MRLFVTGGAGFIGSNFIHLAILRGHEILNFDALTYAGDLRNVERIASNARYRFVKGDIRDRALLKSLFSETTFDVCINFAAETHVDRSIEDPERFVSTNVLGTTSLLMEARDAGVPMFIQISTDEVYGSLPLEGGQAFHLDSPLNPSSAYSASKASADHLAMSFAKTFGMDVRITRCTNNYGRRQHPEKLIPTIIRRAWGGEKIPIYGKGDNVRDWIHVDDHSEGILKVIANGTGGSIYHFGGSNELTNLQVCEQVIRELATQTGNFESKYDNLIEHTADRPGHDLRYALDCTQTELELNWSPQVVFARGLEETVRWYLQNHERLDQEPKVAKGSSA